MAGVTRAAAHLSAEEVARRWKQDPRPHRRQRWLIIYQALVDPRTAEQIAKHCGVAPATVHQLISASNRRGVAAVETPGKGGRRHQYLTLEQEQEKLRALFRASQSRNHQHRCGDSNRRLECWWGLRWPKAPSAGCSTGMAGANWYRVRSIPRPIPPSKPCLKKLRRAGPGGSRYSFPRRSATRLEDGRR
jgi:hypothetical protein